MIGRPATQEAADRPRTGWACGLPAAAGLAWTLAVLTACGQTGTTPTPRTLAACDADSAHSGGAASAFVAALCEALAAPTAARAPATARATDALLDAPDLVIAELQARRRAYDGTELAAYLALPDAASARVLLAAVQGDDAYERFYGAPGREARSGRAHAALVGHLVGSALLAERWGGPDAGGLARAALPTDEAGRVPSGSAAEAAYESALNAVLRAGG